MPVTIGTRLGPYEVKARLGQGGMGVVWMARDSYLGREVALKVLPDEFAADPERLARFESEARLLAQLNHPNIAQVFGLEVSGGTRALVMELIEGPTLAERLHGEKLPLEECLAIAHQLAEALAEAHEHGIVHRDLKPQNVKLTRGGRVKVLDFGLAKRGPLVEDRPAEETTLAGSTQPGAVLGTAGYMAPATRDSHWRRRGNSSGRWSSVRERPKSTITTVGSVAPSIVTKMRYGRSGEHGSSIP
jgi:eukaryotic-like serine/threonine-protein kinase